jgi:hypothetical protein
MPSLEARTGREQHTLTPKGLGTSRKGIYLCRRYTAPIEPAARFLRRQNTHKSRQWRYVVETTPPLHSSRRNSCSGMISKPDLLDFLNAFASSIDRKTNCFFASS